MARRRTSSTLVRKWCYEYWINSDGSLTCYMCNARLDVKKNPRCFSAEHEIPFALGGSDKPPNVKPCCAPNCANHGGHKEKTKVDVGHISKANAVRAKRLGFKRSKSIVPGSKNSKWARRYNKYTGRWETVER